MTETHLPPPTLPRAWEELRAAAIFLTRLPFHHPGPMPADLAARAMAWYPLVGAGIGLLSAAVYAGAAVLALPPAVAALLAVSAAVLATGALHEDGLADVADGLGGGHDRAGKLAIMRDSRVGAYGVLALVLAVGLRAAALAALATPAAVLGALVAAGALSRAVLPALAAALPPARTDGLAAAAGRPPPVRVAAALGLGAALAALALGPAALAAAAAAAAAALGLGHLARRQLGGHTGDVLGAAQQGAEILILLTLTSLASLT